MAYDLASLFCEICPYFLKGAENTTKTQLRCNQLATIMQPLFAKNEYQSKKKPSVVEGL